MTNHDLSAAPATLQGVHTPLTPHLEHQAGAAQQGVAKKVGLGSPEPDNASMQRDIQQTHTLQ